MTVGNEIYKKKCQVVNFRTKSPCFLFTPTQKPVKALRQGIKLQNQLPQTRAGNHRQTLVPILANGLNGKEIIVF